MKIKSTLTCLIMMTSLAFLAGRAKSAEAAWNISTLEHSTGTKLSKDAWFGGLSVKQDGGDLIMESSGTGPGECTQRIVELPAGFDWLVVKIDKMTRPPKGYINMSLRFMNKETPLGFGMAGNVPESLLLTLKLPEDFAASAGPLRLDSTMTRAVFSDFGLYRDPVPRLELVIPATAEKMVPASVEFVVELHIEAPAQSANVSLFLGREMSPVRLASGEPSVILEPVDGGKKIWRGKFILEGAVFKNPNRGEPVEKLGAGTLLLKATVVGNSKIPLEIWTANNRSIDLTK